MIRGVVFDLDDTLYPEVEFVYGGYRAVATLVRDQLGIDIYDELVELFEGGRRGDLFTPVIQAHLGTVEETYVRNLVEVYRNHTPNLSPFPEVRRALSKLKLSYSLAVVSDGYVAVQERKLQALRLREVFDVVIFSDHWGRDYWKPNLHPFKECARSLSVHPSTLVYVGDNPRKDFVGARAIGMKTIRVRRARTLHCETRLSSEYEADYEVSSLKEIEALVRLIAGRGVLRV